MTTPRRLFKSAGDLSLGVAIPRGQNDRMTAVLRFTSAGRPYQIELTRDDLAGLARDLGVIANADVDAFAAWWYKLARDDSRPGALPAAAVPHAS
jgi:hypothetical protein